MLPADNRLRKAYEINRVYKRGVYGAGEGYLSIKAAPSGRPVSRAVVVVGKKVDKRAVVRNRIRRRISGILETLWGTLPGGYDIVISVHQDIAALDNAKLETVCRLALAKARVAKS